MQKQIPSPCIDVCKYNNNGHCVACSMTKQQKKRFRKLKTNKLKKVFLRKLIDQQNKLGSQPKWQVIYEKKCLKKGIEYVELLS